MGNFDILVTVLVIIFGIGITYLPHLLLRKQPKMTGDELKAINPNLEGIHQKYLSLSIGFFLLLALTIYLIYQSNQGFWKEDVFILFILFCSAIAVFDGLFALSTNVFPLQTRYNWNRYIYDGDKKFRQVAFWQIGIAIVFLIIDYVAFRFVW